MATSSCHLEKNVSIALDGLSNRIAKSSNDMQCQMNEWQMGERPRHVSLQQDVQRIHQEYNPWIRNLDGQMQRLQEQLNELRGEMGRVHMHVPVPESVPLPVVSPVFERLEDRSSGNTGGRSKGIQEPKLDVRCCTETAVGGFSLAGLHKAPGLRVSGTPSVQVSAPSAPRNVFAQSVSSPPFHTPIPSVLSSVTASECDF